MIDHEAFRLLAAREIDGDLSADESRELERHLATCASCRAFAAALRRDNAYLRAALAPAPVGAETRRKVLDAAGGRRRTNVRLVPAFAALVLVGLVAAPALLGGGTTPPSSSAGSAPTVGVSASSSPTVIAASVNGAYSYTVGPGATRRDSVTARAGDPPAGEWSRMSPATGGASFGGPITCLVIDGNEAWLAGPATTVADDSGDRAAFLYVLDAGPGGRGDMAVLWMNDPGQTLATMEGWCRDRFIPAGPYPLDEGDVAVDPGGN